jgi:hypothetical protein
VVFEVSTLLSLAEASGIVVLGASSTWFGKRAKDAGEKAVAQTKSTSNGFAAQVTGDLAAIRAHLAAQDMHMIAQDEQLAEVRRVIVRHDKLLKTIVPAYDKD